MTPEALLDRLVPMMLARLPAEQHTAFRAWAKANRDELVEAIREALGGLLEKLRSRASGASDGGIPNAERWSAGERTRANLTAMNIAARLLAEERRPTSNERYALALYSGWGGLSIEGVADKFPPGFPVPEKRGLIHEYYTPGGIAGAVGEAILPLLPGLPRHEDRVAVLEPSAGIGRFIRGLGTRKELDWHAVEWSALSATMLAALYPDIDVFHGPFERWVREQGKDWRGRFGLVLSNPPYGARGSAITVDSDRSFRERKAYAYFLRRGLDMLAPNGLAVFLVPYGFLSGQTDELRALRESILRVAHLSAAYRLPSGIFPGANLVTDLLFFRGRGGTLAEVDETDQGVLAGQYFRAFPKHVLGREVGAGGSDDDQSAKARYGYEVLGEFRGLPPLVERPMCGACAVLQPAAPRAVAEQLRPESELGSAVALALGLAPRLAAYLRDLANDATEQPAQLWRELVDALNAWTSAHGNPHEHRELLTARAAGGPDGEAIATFLSVFTRRGELLAGLREQPVHVPRFQGKAGDLVALAEWVYRQRHHLSWPELAEAAKAQGWRVERERMRELFDAGWCVDGAQWNELEPAEEYLTGALWARYDRAVQQAAAGDEVAAGQARRLLEVIQPVVFDDLTDLSPRDGWIPLDIIERWVSTALQGRFGPVRLARHGGLLQVAGTSYEDLDPSEKGRGVVTADTTWFIGWCNHDRTLFKPKDSSAKIKKEDPDETRLRFETAWNMAFRAWLAVQPTYQRQIEQAYNRHFRGYVAPGSSAEPLQLARWVRKGVRLHAHQNAGARRILRHRGGLLAFDVGVGKTYTGLAILAAARQEGWCKRPVIVVPNSIAWKWYADIRRVLPDYRVAVVGSKRSLAEAPIAAGQVRLAAGARAWADNHPRARTKHQVLNLLKWEWMEASELPEAALTHLKVLADEGAIELKCPQPRVRSGPDTPEERAHKWRQFQLGQVDVVLLTYSMMNRTRLNEESLLHYAEHTSAIQRELELRERNAKKGRGKQSERAQAIADEGAAAWLAQQLELPENNQYDPGIVWDDLNIDLLIVDEAQNFKNLYLPEEREGGVPRFMGNAGEGSKRSWQLDFRAAAVRRKTGGAGVVLLSATPAKNSPLEFYNLLQYIDHDLWARMGIRDPEAFIDRYCKLEMRPIIQPDLRIVNRSACIGFKNLDELRGVLYRYGDFKTAEDVGLKLPEPTVNLVEVALDERQEAKYEVYVRLVELLLSMDSAEGDEAGELEEELVQLSWKAREAGIVNFPDVDPDEPRKNRAAVLGLLTRLSLVAVHAELDNQLGWSGADQVQNITSPKFNALAERVVRTPHCGHIVFCDNVAAHLWMREVLVANGIPFDRIAILNAETAPAAERPRIAAEFNGDPEEGIPPKYDVVIANAVAYEGVDLQTRTCAIHHLDLPWEPATLQQRNGRGVRQGNTLSSIEINYYFALRSQDGMRFNLIQGKRGWMVDLLKSQARETNNPGAQMDLGPDEILLLISRDPESTRARLEQVKAAARERALRGIRDNALRLLVGASARYRRACQIEDGVEAARLRAEGEERLNELARTDVEAWPWATRAWKVREKEPFIDAEHTPLFEGDTVSRALSNGTAERLSFGRVVELDGASAIAFRALGAAHWRVYNSKSEAMHIRAEQLAAPWPAAEDEQATARTIESLLGARFPAWSDLRWPLASAGWRTWAWQRFGPRVVRALLAQSLGRIAIPAIRGGELVTVAHEVELGRVELLPWTDEGYERFKELAFTADDSFKDLADIALVWWRQKLPRGVKKIGKEAAHAAA